MIASRRCPRATPGRPCRPCRRGPRRRYAPSSSGPRWRSTAIIRRSVSGSRALAGSVQTAPVMPHMERDQGLGIEGSEAGAATAPQGRQGGGTLADFACDALTHLQSGGLTSPASPSDPSRLDSAVIRYTSSHSASSASVQGMPRRHRQPGGFVKPPLARPFAHRALEHQANEGMNFGSNTPGVASWAIAPT